MKKKLWLVVLTVITIFTFVIGAAACKDNNPGTQQPEAQQLETPVVSISEEGLASWTANANASGYAYKLDNGEETKTNETSVQLTDGQAISVKAFAKDGYKDSDWSEAKTYNSQSSVQKLSTPVVTINGDGVASWTADPNAVKYAVKVNGTESEQEGTSYNLSAGDKIQVKALGDGTNYRDSGWSAEATYTVSSTEIMTHAEYLAAAKGATVKVQGVVTGIGQDRVYFQDSDGGYLVYGITDLPAEVAVGKTIVAEGVLDIYNGLYEITKATVTVGDTATVIPVDITEVFTAATGMTDAALVNMQSALITLKGATLKVSEGNLYVVIGNNEAQLFVGSGKSHVLGEDALAAIKALVEANEGATADVKGYVTLYKGAFQIIPAEGALDIKGAQTLGTPVVSIDNDGVATWGADPNAEGFIVKIDGVDGALTTATTVTLTNGQKIQVKAVGDGTNYKDSEWSAEKTYNQIVSKPSVKAATISFATDAGRVSHSASAHIWESDGIKFTNEKNKSSNDIVNNINPIRCYKGSSIKVEYTGMVKIVFTTSGGASYYLTLDSTDDYIVTANNEVVTVEFRNPVNEFVIEELANQVRLASIDVYVEKVAQNLSAPEVTIDLDGLATWEPVTGATGYEYVITHSDSTTTTDTTTNTQVQLANGDKIKVKTLGDGEDYISSDYGTEVEYTMVPVTLDTPVVEVNLAGVASWGAVENAVKYVYVINDGEEQETTHRTVQLTNGQSIKVKAVGKEGSRFQASAYCEPVTYTAPTVAEQLENPTITVAIDGTVTIENENAVSFDYTIGDGEKQNVANGADGAAVTLGTKLTNGQTIKVVAKGDGTYYTDSAEVEVTYSAPQALEAVSEVTIAIEGTTAKTVIITWTAVANATGYSYQLGTAAAVTTTDTTVTVTLNEGEVFSIKAIGNTATAETAANGNYSAYYSDSTVYAAPAFAIDNEKTYTVAEIVKITVYYGSTGSGSKKFTVKGVVSESSYYNNSSTPYTIWLSDGSTAKAFELFKGALAGDVKNDFVGDDKVANALVGCIVTANGPLTLYNSTKEFNGCTILAIEVPAEVRVAKAKAALDDKLECVTSDEDYTYTLPLTGEFGTTITWSFEGLEEDDYIYDDEEGTLLVTRKDTDITFTATATISYTNGGDTATDTLAFENLTVLATGTAVPQPPQEVSETFTFTKFEASFVGENITIAFDKADGSTAPGYFDSNPKGIRCYVKNTITITSEATITKIVLTYTKKNDYNTFEADKGNFSEEGSSTFTGTWVGSETSVVITSSSSTSSTTGNCGITSIVVTYEAPNYTDEQKVEKALAGLTDIAGKHNTDFTVETEGKFDLAVSWTTSTTEGDGSITIEGGTATVVRGEQDTTVTVTASITLNEVTKTRDFTVTIDKKPEEGGTDPVEKTWQKVTDIAQIDGILSNAVEELKIVITSSDDKKVMGIYASGNNIAAQDFDKANIPDSITSTLVKGAKDSTYAIKQGNNYLYAASSSANQLKASTTLNDNASWKITVTSAGVATVVAQGTNTRNNLKYNSSSTIFACYSSGQNDISIWVYA